MQAYLIELEGYDTTGAGLTTVRFSSQPYLHGSAPGPYDPGILEPPTFRRDIFSKNTTAGAGAVSQGDLILANPDGRLDYLRPWGFAGQICRVLLGDPAGAYSAFTVLIKGRVEQVLFDLAEVRVRLKDRLQDLQTTNIQPNKYLGTNVLPDGLEGVDDLKDKPKPLVFGRVLNITGALVNTALLIYQVNDGPIADIPAVYDAGESLPRQADYTSQTDMVTNEPTAGYYRVWRAGGYFRLGQKPFGTVTADVNESPTTAANIAKTILLGPAAIPPAEVSDADVAALNADNPATVGIYLDAQVSIGGVLDQILGSIGAWYGADRLSVMRMQRMELPGPPTVTLRRFGIGTDAALDELDIVDLRFLPTADQDRGVPTWQVSLDYARNWTVQSGNGLAGDVADARRSYLAQPTRTAVATDEAVKTPNPAAVTKEVSTLILAQADAEAEAERILALYKTARDFAEIDTPLLPEALQAVDLGVSVTVVIPRFGYDAGRALVITGMEYNTKKQILTLAAWG